MWHRRDVRVCAAAVCSPKSHASYLYGVHDVRVRGDFLVRSVLEVRRDLLNFPDEQLQSGQLIRHLYASEKNEGTPPLRICLHPKNVGSRISNTSSTAIPSVWRPKRCQGCTCLFELILFSQAKLEGPLLDDML